MMSTAVLAGLLNMGPDEQLNLAISFLNRLSSGETLTGSATVTLRDTTTNQLYDDGLIGAATVTTPRVVQTVADLKSGHSYLLNISVDTTQTQVLQGQIVITCEGRPHLV